MKRLWFIHILIAISLLASAQKADFKAAEKFRGDNLTPKYGDLTVNANWIEESDVFWYSFKTSAGKNFYYVNATTRTKQPMFESKYMAAELHKLTHHPYNDLDLPLKDIKFDKKSTTKFTFVVDVLAQPRPKLQTYRYSMPGEPFVPQSELIIFDVTTKKRVDVDIKKWKDQTINVEWTSQKSAGQLILIRKDRPLKNLDVCIVNAETGALSVLFSEETWPYFNDEYTRLSVLNEGNDIIWWSERTGWGQLYLYDGKGNLKNQITNGYFVTGRVERIDTLGRIVYFEAFGKEDGVHPYYSMKYKAFIDKGATTLITKEGANHSFIMSKSNKYFVDTYSTVDKIPEAVLRDNNGNIILKLEKADISQLLKTGWKMPETIVVKAKDGVTDLYGVMYKPFNFDSTRKYPVISYVYPGPQTESVQYSFTVTGGKNIALAQLGFIVVNFGHRGGSPMRNNYYHTFGYNNLRDYPLADDKYGIEQLADKYKFIDIDRVGIYGHSGGGFMSTAAILSYPDFYKVAVSSSGNHDNNIYNQWWGETHNGVAEVEKKLPKRMK